MKLIELLSGLALLCVLLAAGAQGAAGIKVRAGAALEKLRTVSDGYELAGGSVDPGLSRFLRSPRVTEVRVETKKSKTGKSYEIVSCVLYGKELLIYRGAAK